MPSPATWWQGCQLRRIDQRGTAMTYAILDLTTRRRLDRLCELGARPRIISAMLPRLSDTIIRAHWIHAQQRAPSQGGATSRPSSYWSTLRVRLHASFALNAYLHLEGAQIHFIDAYIGAFEEYRAFFDEDSPENFDWFWGLVQNYLDDRIALIECSVCSVNYIHNPDDLKHNRNCPSHRYLLPLSEKSGVAVDTTTPNSGNHGIMIERKTEQTVLPFMLAGHPVTDQPVTGMGANETRATATWGKDDLRTSRPRPTLQGGRQSK